MTLHMPSPPSYHIALKQTALVVAAVNLLTCFACDLREWLVYSDPWFVTIVLLPTFVVGLPSLAFLLKLDFHAPSSTANRLWLGFTTLILMAFESLWFAQIVIATFLRDPLFWTFYWPWEERVPKVVPLNNLDLSEVFWISMLDLARPSNPLLRELPGIALIIVHLVVMPLIGAVALRRSSKCMPVWRILVFAMITQALSGVAIKMLLQNLLNWKYIVALPDQMLNI